MRFSIVHILILFLTYFIYGCTSIKSIHDNFNYQTYSLGYNPDSEVNENKTDTLVKLDSIYFDASLIPEIPVVWKQESYVIPAGIVNIWMSQKKCEIGKSMLKENIPWFIKESLQHEMERSGKFKLDKEDKSNYSLVVNIEELNIHGPYTSKGFFVFALVAYAFSNTDIAGPASSKLKISYKLKNGKEVIHSNTFLSQKLTEQLRLDREDEKSNLQFYFASEMVKATSFNINYILKLIVNDVNSYFKLDE